MIMKIYVDIDNTICKTEGTDYKSAMPIKSNIKKINNLFEKGHEIIYWTARGTVTRINHYDFLYHLNLPFDTDGPFRVPTYQQTLFYYYKLSSFLK